MKYIQFVSFLFWAICITLPIWVTFDINYQFNIKQIKNSLTMFLKGLYQILLVRFVITITNTTNPTQQKQSFQFSLTEWNSSLYFTFETKYTPQSYLYQNSTISGVNKQIIVSIQADQINSISTSYVFLYYLQIDVNQNTLKHYFEVQTQKTKYIEFIKMTNTGYEGSWFTLEVRNDAVKQSLNLTFYQNLNKNSILYQKILLSENLAISDIFSFYLGDSKIAKAQNFNQFQGPVKYNLQPADQKFTPQTQSSCSSTSGSALRSNFSFSSNNYYEYIVSDLISKSYGITTWLKINQNLDQINNFINVIHIQQNPNLQYLTQVGGKLFQISYLINQTKQIAEILYQSYTFPILPQLINNQDPLEKKIILDIPLTINIYNWHYLSVQYKNNQLIINLNFVKQNQIVSKTISNVYQFSDLSIVLHFGGTKFNQSNLDGNFINSYFYNCLTIITPKCHFSCQTCFGPYFNQCLTCSNSSNRQLSYDFMCICKIGYLEINSTSCYSISSTLIQETYIPLSDKKEYDQEYPEVICSYGYFKYDDECYACPKLNKIYFCPECIQYPNTWVYNPKCTKNYGQYDQNINNTFTQDIIFKAAILLLEVNPFDIYLFNNGELTFCSHCSSLCLTPPYDVSCRLGNYYHLQQNIMVVCAEYAEFQDGKCQMCPLNCTQCAIKNNEMVCLVETSFIKSYPYCLSSTFSKCVQCVDNSQYFFNYEKTNCYICQIPNCKYCFQYLLENSYYNSIFNNNSINFNQDDLAIGCALCNSGYIFNFYNGKCEKNVFALGQQCSNYYISEKNIAICISSNSLGLGIEILSCQEYLSKCKRCIKPSFNQYFCVECEFGYYSNQTYGICQYCQDYNQQFLDCFQSEQISLNTVKYQVTPQIFSLTSQYPGIVKPKNLDIYVKQCIPGYQKQSDTQCFPTDSIFCNMYENGCRKCDQSLEGTKRLTILNLKCEDCPYYCEYCKPRLNQELYSLNPYLNQTLITQQSLTYRCIQKSSQHDQIFLDNKQQLTRYCSSQYPKCQLQFSRNFTSFSAFYSLIMNIVANPNIYYNLRSVNIFEIFIFMADTYLHQSSFLSQYTFQNNLISQIISLHTTRVIVNFNDSQKGLIFGKLKFINFQEISFINSSILFSITTHASLIFESKGLQSFKLENVQILDTYQTFSSFQQLFDTKNSSRQYQISIQNPSLINFTNVLVSNLSVINQFFFNITDVNQQFDKIDSLILNNVTFFNCTFINTSIFTLFEKNKFRSITLNQIKFIDCQFYKSYFFNCENLIYEGKMGVLDLNISNCQFFDSVFIKLPTYQDIEIQNVIINQSLIQDTDFFLTSTSVSLNVIRIENNLLINFNFFKKIKNSKEIDSEIYQLTDFIARNNLYSKITFLLLQQQSSELIQLQISNLTQDNLTSMNLLTDKNYYFYEVEAQQVVIQFINFTRYPGSKDFSFTNCNSIQIRDIYISSALYNTDYAINKSLNSLFYINSQYIVLKNIQFYNQLGVDVIFIFIQGNGNYTSKSVVEIEQLDVFNLQLIKTTFSQITTLIQTSCTINQIIQLKFSKFQQILLNEIVQDTKISSAALAVFISDLGQITLQNVTILESSVLNSTNSMFLIQCQDLVIQNIFGTNINNYHIYINDQQIKKFLSINKAIESAQINSLGGLFNIQAQNITIKYSIFKNIIALQGGVFYFTTKQYGWINIFETKYYNITTNQLNQQEGKGGCLFINSENSYLHFTFSENYLQNVTSGQQAGGIYIKPSQYYSRINIQNINMKNIFSIKNSVISLSVADLNFGAISKVSIKNVQLENEFLEFCNFLNNFNLNLNENQISQTNAIIYISDYFTQISNFSFSGFTNQPIFFIKFAKILTLNKIIILKVCHLSNYLIYVENTQTINSSLLIKDVLIEKSSIQNLSLDYKQDINYIINNLLEYKIMLSNQYFQKSLIYLNLKQKLVSGHVKLLYLFENKCEFCNYGLIHISNLQKEKKLRMQNQIYLNNFCGQDSCLSIDSDMNSEIFNFISLSKFINNSAFEHGTINSINSNLQIKRCIFLRNTAGKYGGAINYYNSSKQLYSNIVYYIENKAQIGGAIYDFNTYNNQDDKNCYFFLNNEAKLYGNNLATKPTQLKMYINDAPTIQADVKNKNNQQQEVFYFNHKKMEQNIYFPSGTSINQYFIFDWKNLQFNKFNSSIKIKPLNIFGELMIQQIQQDSLMYDSNCISNSSIISVQNNQSGFQSDSNLIQSIQYDNQSLSYNLNDLIYVLDPRLNKNQSIQVEISCKNILNFTLKFYAKTFDCQIGEFFQNSKCIRCESEQGFYSVEKYSTSCKRIDIQMIKSTTGAMIELQSGYWRPDLRSDLLEKCSKYPIRCVGGWNVADSTCNLGSIGALCEQCDIYDIRGNGNFINNKNENCSKCGQILIQSLFVILQSLWIILLIGLTANSNNFSNKQLFKLKCLYRHFEAIFKQMMDQKSTLIKLANNHFQILSLIETFQIQIKWNIQNVILFLGDTNYMISYQIDCSLPSVTLIDYEYAHFILILIFPLFHFSMCCLVFFFMIICKKVQYSQSYIYTSIIYLYCLNQQNIIKWGVSLISKRTISGIDWIQANVASKYYTDSHQQWSVKFVYPVLVIFGILIPIFLYQRLMSIKGHLDQKFARLKYSFLYNEYNPNSYYWEIVKMAQKILIILIVNYYEQFILVKGLIVFIIILLYYYICQQIKPYKLQSISSIDIKSSFLLSLIISFSLLLNVIQQENMMYLDYSIQFIILLLITILIEAIMHRIIKAYADKLNLELDFIRKIIMKRFPSITQQFTVLKPYLQLRGEQQQRIQSRFSRIKKYLKIQSRFIKENNLLISNTLRESNSLGINIFSQNLSKRIINTERETNAKMLD